MRRPFMNYEVRLVTQLVVKWGLGRQPENFLLQLLDDMYGTSRKIEHERANRLLIDRAGKAEFVHIVWVCVVVKASGSSSAGC